ncbi:MAG TPA: transglutaminase domain-containing protein [Pirellulales bacterium]|nr:transglutaminase domain-containing protein [Pirellulales bacterium]
MIELPKTKALLAPVVMLALAWTVGGCDHRTASIGTTATKATPAQQAEEVFKYAIGMLNDMDESDRAPARLDPDTQNLQLEDAVDELLKGGTAVTVVSQLNQWIAVQKPVPDWRRDPLIETLPTGLQKLPALKQLDAFSFPLSDANDLRQAVWLRSISNTVTRDATDDLDRAVRLFDWTVRNIQLDPADGSAPALVPWQTIALGHGQAADRTWVFVLLARQQGLDVVRLARLEASSDEPQETELTALALDGQLFLFDSWLGLPIPGPAGQRVATLAQAADDDSLLRRLDVGAEYNYPLHASDVEQVVALVEASPSFLSQRMWLVASHLAVDQRLVLAIDASELAGGLRALPHVGDARLWPFPYRRFRDAARRKRAGDEGAPLVIAADPLLTELEPFVLPYVLQRKKSDKPRPVAALWRGRVLHLLGKYTGDEGANFFYQLARPAEIDLEQQVFRAADQAKQLSLRGRELQPQVEQFLSATDERIALIRRAKQDASYWLGLAAFERELYDTALDYFNERTLAATPDGPWTHGAYYNLGRTYEALGQIDEACAAYRGDESSPQRHGNLIRSRWLEEAKKGEKGRAAVE